MNVKTEINGTNSNECNKRNNKAQYNKECTVSCMVVDWKIFRFCLGNHMSVLFFFFCSSCLRIEFLFEE